MNLNNQNALYKHGMTPVFRLSGNPNWACLKQKVAFEEEGRHLQLQFQYRFTKDSEEVLFAFCFPYSYEDCNKDLERCADQARRDGMAIQALLTPKPGPAGYLHRELLIRTPGGRRVDLLTVTDCHGILDEREPQIDPHLFPEEPEQAPTGRRPFEFEGKDVVFVSARVHPGETPASFVFQGILRFLLDPGDPRAAELRRRFIFKMVPLLNPDGVAAGHFRQDLYGNNLNRHYLTPDAEEHSSVYAAKAVVMHHAARPAGRGRLTVYLDLHAHASARGCFIYGNHLPSLEDQAENQLLPLLMTLNTPHFDFSSCNFTLKHMSRVDSGDAGLSAEGTGRVFYGRHAGVLRSYTLECNYNTGKAMCNHIPPAHSGKGGERFASPERKATTPPRYQPEVWRDVGAGFLKALLDAEGASVWSRLPNSKFRTLERAKKHLVNELRIQPSYREQSLLLRRGASTVGNVSARAAAAPFSLPPPPHKSAPAPLPSSPPHGTEERRVSTARGTPPPKLSRKATNFDKVHSAPATVELAGSGGGSPSLSGRKNGNNTAVSSSLMPPPLLPRRPGRNSPIGRRPAVSRSRSGGSVRRTLSGLGGNVSMPMCFGSSSGSSRSGSSQSDSGRSTVATRTMSSGSNKPSSPVPVRYRSVSKETRTRQPHSHSTGVGSSGSRRTSSIGTKDGRKASVPVRGRGDGGGSGRGGGGGDGGNRKSRRSKALRPSPRPEHRRRSSRGRETSRDPSATPSRCARRQRKQQQQ
eukprot:g5469.t1